MANRINLNEFPLEEEVFDEVLRLRELRVQEAIVKVMKMRQVLSQNLLHNELIDVLKAMFVPSRRLIKQQIDFLIEKEYLKRSEEDIEKLMFIA